MGLSWPKARKPIETAGLIWPPENPSFKPKTTIIYSLPDSFAEIATPKAIPKPTPRLMLIKALLPGALITTAWATTVLMTS